MPTFPCVPRGNRVGEVLPVRPTAFAQVVTQGLTAKLPLDAQDPFYLVDGVNLAEQATGGARIRVSAPGAIAVAPIGSVVVMPATGMPYLEHRGRPSSGAGPRRGRPGRGREPEGRTPEPTEPTPSAAAELVPRRRSFFVGVEYTKKDGDIVQEGEAFGVVTGQEFDWYVFGRVGASERTPGWIAPNGLIGGFPRPAPDAGIVPAPALEGRSPLVAISLGALLLSGVFLLTNRRRRR